MAVRIEAILFDMGGTLRRATNREISTKIQICRQIQALVGSGADPADFTRTLSTRAENYQKWSRLNLCELNEADLWTGWMLPDFPPDKIGGMAVRLNVIWRDACREYQIFPETKETVLALFRAGYRLGLVSNTTSSIEAPRLLEENRISGCFETIVLSCQVGKRKPDASILLEATRRMGVRPEQCAYIGNLPDRDVNAARSAGFNQTVILRDSHRPVEQPEDPSLLPDHYIDNLKELLAIFPPIHKSQEPVLDAQIYDISFSTMWGIRKFDDLNDFLLASQRLGMARVELNHQISTGMLENLDLSRVQVSSIHEPCPAEIPSQSLRKLDLLISSPDEFRRQKGAAAIRSSIDLAYRLGAHTVVVHPGQVQADASLENKLREWIAGGMETSSEFLETRDRLVDLRASMIGPYMQSVKKSVLELLDYAGDFRVRLGIENRYHYLDIPNLDEMGEILDLAGPDRLGFLYDVGHAHTLDRLGFIPHEQWLQRYASRIIGVHLHDVVGVDDHRAPGLGEVDFKMVASYLPKDAYRVLEIQSHNTIEQITAGLQILVAAGCVNKIG